MRILWFIETRQKSNEEKEKSFKRPEAPEYSKPKPVEKESKSDQPKVMLENRSIQEIEEEKRAKQEEQDCMELYDDKCYTPPLIDKPPPKVRDRKNRKIYRNFWFKLIFVSLGQLRLYRLNLSCWNLTKNGNLSEVILPKSSQQWKRSRLTILMIHSWKKQRKVPILNVHNIYKHFNSLIFGSFFYCIFCNYG